MYLVTSMPLQWNGLSQSNSDNIKLLITILIRMSHKSPQIIIVN